MGLRRAVGSGLRAVGRAQAPGRCSRGKESGFAQNASRWRFLRTGQGMVAVV